jgi:ABC-2 type transport system ATP-binding protein
MTAITIENLTKIYQVPVKQSFIKSIFIPKNRDVVAVDNISLEIKKGESVALLGPNGAGKTTSLKMLTGLLYPTSGTVKVLGHTPVDRKYTFLSQIALVMGNKSGLSWDLSAYQSFKLFQSIYRLEKKEAENTIDQLATLLEIQDSLHIPIRKLSLGQRLKMELIGAILHKPKLLFLDEPTIGLDVVAKRKIRDFLRKLHEEKETTIILTSHEMADIEKVCNRVVVINQGKLVFDNSLAKLNKQYQNKKYLNITFSKNVSTEKLETLGKVIKSNKLSHTLEIKNNKQAETISKLASSFPIRDIDIRNVPLDEIIEDIFKKTS